MVVLIHEIICEDGTCLLRQLHLIIADFPHEPLLGEKALRHDQKAHAAVRPGVLPLRRLLDAVEIIPFPHERQPVEIHLALCHLQGLFIMTMQRFDAPIHRFQPGREAHEIDGILRLVTVVEAAEKHDNAQIQQIDVHIDGFGRHVLLLERIIADVER